MMASTRRIDRPAQQAAWHPSARIAEDAMIRLRYRKRGTGPRQARCKAADCR